ncbi:F-box only protein 43-like [Gordionus sp. m RMFG-2023]|uniref:F-box only protein 43-like n=1 Tax=Gordionus sp. m RMFG-2023 TaxID=3053472 RepID=UPI0031FBCFED
MNSHSNSKYNNTLNLIISKPLYNSTPHNHEYPNESGYSSSFIECTKPSPDNENHPGTPSSDIIFSPSSMILQSDKTIESWMHQQLNEIHKFPIELIIGKKMGREKIDYFKEFYAINCYMLIDQTLATIQYPSFCKICLVSKLWCHLVQNSNKYKKGLQKYNNFHKNQEQKENINNIKHKYMEQRKPLKNLEKQLNILPKIPFAEVNKNYQPSKLDIYIKKAKTLKNCENFVPCPKCHYPALFKPIMEKGVCTSTHCGFQFCSKCKLEFHKSIPCLSMSNLAYKEEEMSILDDYNNSINSSSNNLASKSTKPNGTTSKHSAKSRESFTSRSKIGSKTSVKNLKRLL